VPGQAKGFIKRRVEKGRFEMSETKSLTLEEERRDETSMACFAHVDPNGQFTLTDFVAGAFSKEAFGFEDVEWNLVVSAADKELLLAKLSETARRAGEPVPAEGGPDDRLLALVGLLYSGDTKAYTHFREWLDAEAVPYGSDFWPSDRVSKPELKVGDRVLWHSDHGTYMGTLVKDEDPFWLVELDDESNGRMEKATGKTSEQLELPPRHRYTGWSRLSLDRAG
jgi:hypothetical protein